MLTEEWKNDHVISLFNNGTLYFSGDESLNKTSLYLAQMTYGQVQAYVQLEFETCGKQWVTPLIQNFVVDEIQIRGQDYNEILNSQLVQSWFKSSSEFCSIGAFGLY